MSNRKHVMPSFKELMEDLKPMTFREKVDHLWTYYKEYLFLAVLAVILATGLITAAINANRETLVLGIVANSPMSQEGKEYLEKGYAEKIGAKNDWEVLLHTTNFQSMEDPISAEDNYNAAQMLTARVSAGQLEYAIVDELAMSFYVTQAVFLDLRELFTEEELAQLAQKDMLMYATEGDVDENGDLIPGTGDIEGRFPVGLKLKDTAFGQEALYGKTNYFVVSGNNPDKEHVRGIWEHILDWENRKN